MTIGGQGSDLQGGIASAGQGGGCFSPLSPVRKRKWQNIGRLPMFIRIILTSFTLSRDKTKAFDLLPPGAAAAAAGGEGEGARPPPPPLDKSPPLPLVLPLKSLLKMPLKPLLKMPLKNV